MASVDHPVEENNWKFEFPATKKHPIPGNPTRGGDEAAGGRRGELPPRGRGRGRRRRRTQQHGH